MIAALCIVPLFAAAGLGLDMTNAYSAKTKLDNAADSAALAALQSAARASPIAGSVENFSAQELLGNTMMMTNIEQEYGISINSFTVEVANNGTALEAKATYDANLDTTIMRVFSRDQIRISNTVLAATSLSKRMNLYMLLDNTPSMGVGATPSDISALERATKNHPNQALRDCAFACHTTEEEIGTSNYDIAKNIGVDMRIDVVRTSTRNLIEDIKRKQAYSGQVKVGIYSFGTAAEDLKLTELAAPSSDFHMQMMRLKRLDLMTIPYQRYKEDQLTDYDGTLKSLTKIIKSDEAGGDDSEKIVFLVTDGVGDSFKPLRCTRPTVESVNNVYGRCVEPIDARVCDSIKNNGYKLAILYTTYLALPDSPFYVKWVSPFHRDLSKKLESCATAGMYAEVGFGSSVPDAMISLFNAATAAPRLIY
ncbi:pilus assembly protein TadG-related protein [Pseudohoeflea suaedae]|nr:pilus assembly protein TadG-related protein [Pseudohoeflea suaedae]